MERTVHDDILPVYFTQESLVLHDVFVGGEESVELSWLHLFLVNGLAHSGSSAIHNLQTPPHTAKDNTMG